MDAHNDGDRRRRRWSVDWTTLAFVGFLAIGAFLLLSEHRAHALGALPFLILLACPLLHVLHHGGHRGPGGTDGQQSDGGRHRH